MTFFDTFFLDRSDLLNRVKTFDTKHHLGILKELSTKKNETQFLSRITEVHFGIFLDNLCSSISYEKSFDTLTPDWTIEINDQTIIAEVLRLNPSASDKVELDFDDNFMNAIQEIPIGCFLNFDYDENEIDRKNIDIQQCKILIEEWLHQNPRINDVIILFDTLEVQLLEFKNDVEHACLGGGGGTIKFDYRRLHADNSPLVKKATKYSSIIDKYNLPYIICIYMDFHTWFRKDDLYRSLYGLSTEHLEDVRYYSHLIEKALYYSPNKIMKDVSGHLLRQGDEYTYYHNFSNSNRLNDATKEIFLKWQHPYE